MEGRWRPRETSIGLAMTLSFITSVTTFTENFVAIPIFGKSISMPWGNEVTAGCPRFSGASGTSLLSGERGGVAIEPPHIPHQDSPGGEVDRLEVVDQALDHIPVSILWSMLLSTLASRLCSINGSWEASYLLPFILVDPKTLMVDVYMLQLLLVSNNLAERLSGRYVDKSNPSDWNDISSLPSLGS